MFSHSVIHSLVCVCVFIFICISVPFKMTSLSFSNCLLFFAPLADNHVSQAIKKKKKKKLSENKFLIFSTPKHLLLDKDSICWFMVNFLIFSDASSFLAMFAMCLAFYNTADQKQMILFNYSSWRTMETLNTFLNWVCVCLSFLLFVFK